MLLSTGLQPTDQEQLMLEELNAIRANPTAYGQSIGLNLSSVAPAPPLAFNTLLESAAQAHSQDMNDNNYFGHIGSDGSNPGQRITTAGFVYTSYGESIAAGYSSPASALQGLIVDSGDTNLDHRIQLLAMTSEFLSQNQVGIGIVTGSGSYGTYYTIDTAQASGSSNAFVTGVVFNDANKNGQYDIGEGLGGITVTANNGASTTTFNSGGYSLQLAPGTYTLTFSGGVLGSPITRQVTIGTENVEVDVIPPVTPTLAPIANQTVSNSTSPLNISLNASDPNNLSLTYAAVVSGYSQLYALQQQYQFNAVGLYTYGATAYVLSSSISNSYGNPYYLLSSSGSLYAYDGSGSYAHSFSNGTAIASLGADVFADPTLLTNALPSINYSTLQTLQQQYGFQTVGLYTTYGTTAYVLSSSATNAYGNGYYLLSSSGSLYVYDGSGSYAHSFSNGTAIANLGSAVYSDPVLLTGASVMPAIYNQMYSLEQEYDFKQYGVGYYVDTYGQAAYVMTSPIGNPGNWGFYVLLPDGTLHAYDGSGHYGTGPVIATLNSSAYVDAALLVNAKAVANPTIGISVSGNQLTLTPGSFVGTFEVTASAIDSLGAAQQTFLVTINDAAPTLTVTSVNPASTIQSGSNQTVQVTQFPYTAPVTASDPEGDVVTLSSPVVSGSSQLSALEQQYGFRGLNYYTNGGITAYVLVSATGNAANGGFYLLRSDGTLFAYDGSGSYAHSFTGTPIASLGTAVYTDPTLLTNALPSVNYSTLQTLEQQYQFKGIGFYTFGTTAYVLSSPVMNSFGNPYYLLRSDGSLFAYDGSGSYAHSFSNGTAIASLDSAVYADPTLLTGASVTSTLYDQMYLLEQQYDFRQYGAGYYTDGFGQTAFIMISPTGNPANGGIYILLPDGRVHAYDGSAYFNTGPVVATLNSSAYTDAALLVNAKAPPSPTGVTATFSNGNLVISNPNDFLGTFQIALTATDNVLNLTNTQSFLVTSTETAPTIAITTGNPATTIQPGRDQTVLLTQFPFTASVTTSDAEGDAVTLSSPVVSGNNLLSALEQQYDFRGLNYYTVGGVTAYVLTSPVGNASNGGFYLLRSDGTLFAYDGSGSYAHSFTGTPIASLGAAVYSNPSLLTNATASAVPAGVSATLNNGTLTVTNLNNFVGTFQIILTAIDNTLHLTTTQNFLITVTT